ncbi:MAG: hypothetical protein MJZ16_00620 [Bacteroidales bacterium]|nr:hypothetical protein [Bacteroidales bacterium]
MNINRIIKTILLTALTGALALVSCAKMESYGITITNIIENHSSHTVEASSMSGLSFKLSPGEKCSLEVDTIIQSEPSLDYLKDWDNPFTHGWLNGLTIDGTYYMIIKDDEIPDFKSTYELMDYLRSIDPFMYKNWENISYESTKATFKFVIDDKFIDTIIGKK